MDIAGEERKREKWNQRYLEGTNGTLPPDPLLLAAFDRYLDGSRTEGIWRFPSFCKTFMVRGGFT